MAKLTFKARRKLERLLDMEAGYVLDFSDRTFEEFVKDSVNLAPYEQKYSLKGNSKANHLRAIWEHESDTIVTKLIRDLLDHAVDLKRITLNDAQTALGELGLDTPDVPTHLSLKYPVEWRFDDRSASPLPSATVDKLCQLAFKIAAGSPDKKETLETIKSTVASASGSTASRSTSYDWAQTDLRELLLSAAKNGATLIDGYWAAVETLRGGGLGCPTAQWLDTMLAETGAPYRLEPPYLKKSTADAVVSLLSDDETATWTRYTLHETLGQGGSATVHRATRDTALGTFEYAVKLLDPSPFGDDRDRAMKRFRREVSALLSVQHRGLVQYWDAGFDNQGRPFVVMPLIRGLNLRDATEGRDPAETCALLIEMLRAIEHAHGNDLLHRDLKPSNVLVRDVDQQVIVVDFGCAYLFESADAELLTTSALGTPGYVPSEVLADPKRRSPLHDIFACGVVTYEVFARKRPDPATYVPLAEIHPHLAPLDGPVRRAIAGEHDRYEKAKEFRQALSEALQEIRALRES